MPPRPAHTPSEAPVALASGPDQGGSVLRDRLQGLNWHRVADDVRLGRELLHRKQLLDERGGVAQ